MFGFDDLEGASDSPEDRKYRQVCQLVFESQKASASWLQRQMGGAAKTAEFARLFLVPGVNHGFKGAGPSPVGQFEALVRWVEQCFPGVSTQRVVPWAGLRPMMPNMLPKVGPGRLSTVFYNTGHGHLGWTLSAITAEMLADAVDTTVATPLAASR